MITYAEVKNSPSGWLDAMPDEKETSMSFQSDLTALIDSVRNQINKMEVSRLLVGAADIVEKDEGWIYDEVNVQPEPSEPATLTGIDPTTAVIGAAALTVTATGTNFTADSVVVVNSADSATTFVSATELTTQIDPATATAGNVPVLVRTPAGETAPLNFTFTAAGE